VVEVAANVCSNMLDLDGPGVELKICCTQVTRIDYSAIGLVKQIVSHAEKQLKGHETLIS